jgi:biopolymer transport protein ExbD
MRRRIEKKTPELNVTSLCDIITVSIFALFMTLVIVIEIAMRTPKVEATPLARATTNVAVYVECRNNQLFYVDRGEIMGAMDQALADIRARVAAGDPMSRQAALSLDVGNTFYRIDTSMMAMSLLMLIPREAPRGAAPPSEANPGLMGQLAGGYDPASHYFVFLVRDDSFEAFRQARAFSAAQGFLTGWEYLMRDEPLTFDGLLRQVRAE